MVWNSVWLMTVFDLLIIAVIIYVSVLFYRRRNVIQRLNGIIAVAVMLTGLAIIGLFYLADLFTMFVLPLFMPMMQAMDIMEQLHLNYLWYVMLVGITFLVVGVSQLIHVVFPRHVEVLERLHDERKQLAHQATTDPLTGLFNRRMFYDVLDNTMYRARQDASEFAIMFIDLDGFKPINDAAGHDTGDKVLVGVAERIQRSTRHTDTLARCGGDEFMLCLNDVNERAVIESLALNILSTLSEPFLVGDASYSIGASIGVARYPNDGDSIDSLIEVADAAMYKVKRQGGQAIGFAEIEHEK